MVERLRFHVAGQPGPETTAGRDELAGTPTIMTAAAAMRTPRRTIAPSHSLGGFFCKLRLVASPVTVGLQY